jgi:flavodoxin
MKAIIIFDTRYGNTEKIAKSIEKGLKESGSETICINVKDTNVDLLKQYDLICVGAPTEWHTLSKPMKEFLNRVHRNELSGKFGFAFDTRLDIRFSGSAAKLIEKNLKSCGLQIIASLESAIVFRPREGASNIVLKEGEEAKFEQIGARIGAALAANIDRSQREKQ